MSEFADGRTIIHAGDGNVFTAVAPDVCKTPSPGGPIPVPYPNIAKSSDLDGGTKTVQIEGNSVAIDGANLKISTGDEAGSAGGGIVSSKIKGKMTWASASADVFFEGKGVIRFLEPTLHNGNASNATGVAPGSPDAEIDVKENCAHCGKPYSDSSHKPANTQDDRLAQEANTQPTPATAQKVGSMKAAGKQVFAASGGGDGKLFNLASGQEIPLTIDQQRDMVAGGNALGNCCEQKMLRNVFINQGQPFPPAGGIGSIKIGVTGRMGGKPSAKELRGAKAQKPCKTCEKAMVAMLCTNEKPGAAEGK